MLSKVKAFTLIELLVVVLIIGILTAVALPQYQKAVEKARVAQALVLVRTLAEAQRLYYLANGEYASSFEQLDVVAPPWTGNSRWVSSFTGLSNEDWSLQLWNSEVEGQGHGIYLGRISGPYTGTGFMYWLERTNNQFPLNRLVCYERTYGGIIFDGADGDYCQKVMGGTKYIARTYTLSY